MTERKERGWVEKVLPGLFKQDDSPPEDKHLVGEQFNTDSFGEETAAPAAPSLVGVSQTTSTITSKLATLKSTLEFEGKDKSRLEEIGSAHELLLYVYDVMMFKFNKLHEIGLLSPNSAEVVGLISGKLESFLKSQEQDELKSSKELAELKTEHHVLTEQYEALQAKFLQKGVITEREIAIEKECNYLKARIRELETFLRVAQREINILTANADLVQSLRAKNSLLSSKVEHQARLLRSLAIGRQENQEFISTIEKLNSENSQMKDQLDRQGELLQKFQSEIPEDSSTATLVRNLIDENVELLDELKQKQQRLESLALGQSAEDMLAQVDQLENENIQLRSRLEASESLLRMLTAWQQRAEHPAEVEETLQSENQRLKQLLVAQKEQIKVLSSDQSSRPFVQVITRLKDENRQLRKISDQKTSYVAQLLMERKRMQKKLRQCLPLAEESKRFRGELEFQKKLVASYRRVEYDYELLKRKYYRTNTQYLIAQNENAALNKRLNRLAFEYKSLVQEYENLFGKS